LALLKIAHLKVKTFLRLFAQEKSVFLFSFSYLLLSKIERKIFSMKIKNSPRLNASHVKLALAAVFLFSNFCANIIIAVKPHLNSYQDKI